MLFNDMAPLGHLSSSDDRPYLLMARGEARTVAEEKYRRALSQRPPVSPGMFFTN